MSRLLMHSLVMVMLSALPPLSAAAEVYDRAALLQAWCADDNDTRLQAIETVLQGASQASAQEREWAQQAIQAYRNGDLACAEGTAYRPDGEVWRDLRSGETVQALPAAANPFLSLPLRRRLEPVANALTLLVADEAEAREAAAERLGRNAGAVPVPLIRAAVEREENPRVVALLRPILAEVALRSGTAEEQLEAIAFLRANPSRTHRNLIESVLEDEDLLATADVRAAAASAAEHIRLWLRASGIMTVIYHGMSYGSVLFLAALGLAVIFGLMGVINLAQAEFVMLGAYLTWFTQELVRLIAPEALDVYLLAAVPVAFAGPALVGMAVEWGVVRHLYHRPLLTLLATWAISLLLINLVRVLVGTQNLSFHTPDYLRSGFTVFAEFSVTWSRLLSIAFAAVTLVATLFVLYRTRFGLRLRATTQNRHMASCVGISTRRTDSLAFGFGSGLAGLAGLALANIYNVNPTMGTHLIIDSFIVVVVGGVGSVLGTALAALGIGQLNAVIEPQFGAVASKVLVLLAVILFIQQRPNGLFPQRGRR